LLPAQSVLAVPVEMLRGGGDYLRGLRQAQADETAARARMAALAERAARTEQLAQENSRLRALLELRPAVIVRSLPAEVMYEAADTFSRKVFIDRGTQHGVVLGAPVINEAGVVGQVTRAFALTSEVTLLVDKDAAIPVINTRTQQRSAAFGGGGVGPGGMELRFVSGPCRRESGRCAADQRPGWRLPAGPAGGQRQQRGAPRRSGFCTHWPGACGCARRCAPRAGAGAVEGSIAAPARAGGGGSEQG
jgi:hypothetical protein